MPIYPKVNGEHKEMDKGFVKVGDSWKDIEQIFSKVNGTWKETLSGGSPILLVATIEEKPATPDNLFYLTVVDLSTGTKHVGTKGYRTGMVYWYDYDNRHIYAFATSDKSYIDIYDEEMNLIEKITHGSYPRHSDQMFIKNNRIYSLTEHGFEAYDKDSKTKLWRVIPNGSAGSQKIADIDLENNKALIVWTTMSWNGIDMDTLIEAKSVDLLTGEAVVLPSLRYGGTIDSSYIYHNEEYPFVSGRSSRMFLHDETGNPIGNHVILASALANREYQIASDSKSFIYTLGSGSRLLKYEGRNMLYNKTTGRTMDFITANPHGDVLGLYRSSIFRFSTEDGIVSEIFQPTYFNSLATTIEMKESNVIKTLVE